MSRRFGYLFVLTLPVLVAAYIAAGMLGFGGEKSAGLVYDTQPVSRGQIRKVVASSGPVRALVTVSVGSELSGQIEQVRVDFNSEVKPGDIMATIDNRTFAARVAQANADLAAAEAALVNQEAVLLKANAAVELSERNIARQRTLAGKGFASQSALDQAVRDSAVAKADIAVGKAQIESAKANIAQRKAALDQASIDLDRTDIRAPIAGTVISRTVDPGQTVASSLQAPELFKIAQELERVRIEAQVNEADIGAVAEGNSVTFTVDAYPERQFEGRVTQVRLAATEISNVVTYTVIVEAANEDRRLFPGMTANVNIESASREGALRVPNDAFRFRPREEKGQASPSSDRTQRLIERLRAELKLTEAQVATLADALAKLAAEQSTQAGMGGSAADQAATRQKMQARVEQTLAPLLTEEQRPLYEVWRRGRETSRVSSVWVLSASGRPERRFVRTGVADDQSTEVLGGDLGEGDAVIIRARSTVP